MVKKLSIGFIFVALVAGGVTFAIVSDGNSSDAATKSTATSGKTATVTKGDVVERDTYDGTLGYDDIVTFANRRGTASSQQQNTGQQSGASGGGQTLTALADEGVVVKQGETLFSVDRHPTVLMHGTVPAYRTLETGVDDGPDVKQLEQALRNLGYDSKSEMTIDDVFTTATATAVKRWQKALGVEQTGKIEAGDIVFYKSDVRIGQHKVHVGDVVANGSAVTEASSLDQVVTVKLDARKQTSIKEGDNVTVALSTNSAKVSPGRITKVGSTASSDAVASGSNSSSTPTIEITISVDEPDKIGRFDQAPVKVGITRSQATGVLVVPVTALLSQTGGTYGLEVIEGSTTRIVAVKIGLTGNGLVEIRSGDVHEGTKVGVAG